MKSKTTTDPMFSMPAARAGSDTLPDAPDPKTDPAPAVALGDPSTTSVSADESSTDPGPPPEMTPGSESARVDDVLKNMRGPRVWSPPAATGAESSGADFVAYHAVGGPAKRHDTPAIGERVVLDITVPSPPPMTEDGANSPADELAALIQESRLRGAAASDGRDGATVVRASRRRPALAIFAVALLLVLVLGGVAVWGARAGEVDPRVGSAAPAVTVTVPPASTVSARPAAQPSAASESPSAEVAPAPPASTVGQAVTPMPVVSPGARAPSVPAPAAPPRGTMMKVVPSPARSTPTAPSPSVPETKPDNPKNDLPRSL